MKNHISVVGIPDIRAHLSELLEGVEKGDIITITKHGQPIARIVPYHTPAQSLSRKEILNKLGAIRSEVKGIVEIQEYINEGRKY